MARMNWEKANQRDRMRRYEFSGEKINRAPKLATDKQVLTIFKYKMLESIPTDMTLEFARSVIAAYAAEHWKQS